MNIRTIPKTLSLLLAVSNTMVAGAHEGMWLPTVLASVHDHMAAEGLKLSVDDIYSANHSSLKDAIVLFGGGCTAEVISDQGLILTNHHCGFSAIQEHSSLENDYLKNGFWAATMKDELMNPGLTATFIVRMEDVTRRIMATLQPGFSEAQRKEAVAKESATIGNEATEGGRYSGVVRSFNYGNQYILIVSETFRDVRLVGAPQGSIGNFGGDTDNWMWPRHTCDFSMFRIYTGPDGYPADPSPGNVPMHPRHVLPISMDGVKEGDFAMIFGFPGQTQRYLTSYAVDYVMNVGDPLKIRMRRASLAVIDEAMLASDRTRIQYADKQKGISNAYKKWIGEVRGLNELHALDVKRGQGSEYRKRAAEQSRTEFSAALDSLQAIYTTYPDLAEARDLYVEFFYVGPELFRFANAYGQIASEAGYNALRTEGKLDAEVERLRAAAKAFHKDFDASVDKRILNAQFPIYRSNIDPVLGPDMTAIDAKYKNDPGAWADDVYATSVFADPAKLDGLLANFTTSARKKLLKDPALKFAMELDGAFQMKVKPVLDGTNERIAMHMRTYVQGLIVLFPENNYWPDANSTLRLSYGKVEGSSPRDGMIYEPFTDLDGVLEKYKPGDPEFDLPQRMLDLHAAKDYAPYGSTSTMPVCFTSSLHTTGGNSGSPVLNGNGELIGINFDRTWESTMSDIQFDPAKCRNISADIRYVLFVIDKVCGAGHLVKEMKLVHHDPVPLIELPIHR
ncbi:MAG: S46 family peptidase [Flavobacteriales bacterium]